MCVHAAEGGRLWVKGRERHALRSLDQLRLPDITRPADMDSLLSRGRRDQHGQAINQVLLRLRKPVVTMQRSCSASDLS